MLGMRAMSQSQSRSRWRLLRRYSMTSFMGRSGWGLVRV
jgi:hypothetical protein